MHVDRRSVLETILICRPFLLGNRRDALFSVANGREVRKNRFRSKESLVEVPIYFEDLVIVDSFVTDELRLATHWC